MIELLGRTQGKCEGCQTGQPDEPEKDLIVVKVSGAPSATQYTFLCKACTGKFLTKHVQELPRLSVEEVLQAGFLQGDTAIEGPPKPHTSPQKQRTG